MFDQTLAIISIVICFMCVVLAAFLIAVPTERKLPNRLFAIFLILTAMDVSAWIVMGSDLAGSWPDAARSSLGALQMPVFVGFFVTSLYSNVRLKWRDCVHLVPFLVMLLLTLPGGQLPWVTDETVASPDSRTLYMTQVELVFGLIVSHVQYYTYIVAAIVILLRFRSRFQQMFADSRSEIFRWLSQLLIVSIYAHTLTLVRSFVSFGTMTSLFQGLQLSGALIVLSVVTWVTLKALLHPEIFRGIDGTSSIPLKREAKPTSDTRSLSAEKKRLVTHMDGTRPYLDPELNLKTLADQMAFTPRELSELINLEFGVHFFDFVNGYRVDAAKVMLTDQPERTVLDVLYAVGFNSKSSFNTAFKKRTHMTPSAFRKSRGLARSMA